VIQPKYFVWDEAPMKYYKFVKIVLIIGACLNLFAAIDAMAEHSVFFYTAFLAAAAVLSMFAVIGLWKKQWFGPRCLIACYMLETLYYLVICVLELAMKIDASQNLIQAIVNAAILIPTWIYFAKRRPLFTGSIVQK
jgi:uncharacterized membrane protein